MSTRRSMPGVALLLLVGIELLAGCHGPPSETDGLVSATAVDAAERVRLIEEAQARLRKLGRDRYTVEDFRFSSEKRFELHDDFDTVTRLYAIDFTATVRFTRDLEVPDQGAMAARMGQLGWTVDETMEDLELFDVLGTGAKRAGGEQRLRAAAVFDDLEPGLRFNRLDRWR